MFRHASEIGDLRVALVGPSEQADRADTEVARLTIIPYSSHTEVVKLRLRTNWILRILIMMLTLILSETEDKQQDHPQVHGCWHDEGRLYNLRDGPGVWGALARSTVPRLMDIQARGVREELVWVMLSCQEWGEV